MIEVLFGKIAFMQFFSLYDLFYQWESAGVFDFLLPILLIFAVVFGILTQTKVLGEHRGINFIIAAVIALLAMRLSIVSEFFALLFPGLGIGIAVLVVVMVMAGLFMSDANYKTWLPTFFWSGIVIGAIIVIAVLNDFAWFGSFWWQQNWVSIVWIIVLVVVLLPLLMPKKSESEERDENARFVLPVDALRGRKSSGRS